MDSGGYTVRLGALQSYADRVGEAIGNYESIVEQLIQGDVTRAAKPYAELICDPRPEHGGAPEAFADACESTIKKYAELYSKMLRAHELITARLREIQTGVTETHQVYSNVENGNTERLNRLFNDGFAGNGDDHGAS